MLLEQQRAFRQAVFEGRVEAAKAALREDAIGRDARLAIYRNNSIGSLIGVLRAAYPVIDRIVGADFFNEAAGRFATANPPDRPHLSAYGAGFADFLETTPAARGLPYLGDVARLEWARIEAYFAEDAPPLAVSALARIEPSAIAETRLVAHPSARLVASRFPIHTIWSVNQPGNDAVPKVDMGQGEAVLVQRPGLEVRMFGIGPVEHAFLAGLFAGRTIGAVAQALPEDEDAPTLQDLLAAALNRGVFSAFRLS